MPLSHASSLKLRLARATSLSILSWFLAPPQRSCMPAASLGTSSFARIMIQSASTKAVLAIVLSLKTARAKSSSSASRSMLCTWWIWVNASLLSIHSYDWHFTEVAEPLVRKKLRYLVLGEPRPRPNTKLADLMTPGSAVLQKRLLRLDHRFGRPDYFKLRLFKKLEVLVLTEHYLPYCTGHYKLKAVESKYPDFKRPMVIFKILHF